MSNDLMFLVSVSNWEKQTISTSLDNNNISVIVSVVFLQVSGIEKISIKD